MTDKKRDKLYRFKYGITLDDYNRMVEDQGGVCAICKKPPVNNNLSVDHCHKWRYIKINTDHHIDFWLANAEYYGGLFFSTNKNKNSAIRDVRKQLQRRSVRGLLCVMGCNPGLRKFSDDPIRFENAAKYLRKHQEKK